MEAVEEAQEQLAQWAEGQLKMAIISKPNDQYVPLESGVSVDAGSSYGRSISQIGQVQQQGADMMSQMALESARVNEQYFQQAKGAMDTAEYTNAINKSTVAFSKGVLDRYNKTADDKGNPTFGTLPDDVTKIGKDIHDQIAAEIVSPEARQKFQQTFNSMIASKQIEAMGESRKQQEGYMRKQEVESFNTQSEVAIKGTPVDAFAARMEFTKQIDSMVANGAMDPATGESKKLQFKEYAGENRGLYLLETDPYGVLEGTKPGNDGTYLANNAIDIGEKTKLELYKKAQMRVDHIERMAAATENARIQTVKDLMTEADKVIERGGKLDDNAKRMLMTGATGTPLETDAAYLMEKAEAVQAFSASSPLEREQLLNRMRGKGDLTDAYETLDRVNKKLNEEEKRDLFSFAQSQGIIPEVKPLDFKNGGLADQLAQRRQAIALIEGHYGKKTSGMTEQEIAALEETARNMAPSQKVNLYKELVQGLGSKSGEVFSKLAAKGSRDEALIGVMAMQGRGETAIKIMAGNQYIKEGVLKLEPKAKDALLYQGTRYIPETSNTAFRADIVTLTNALYAQKSVQANDYSGNINPKRYQEALNEVMGGEPKAVLSNSMFDPGSKVVLPNSNMSSADFEKWTRTITDQEINQIGGWAGWDSGMSAQLQKARLQQDGFGRYRVLIPSDLNPAGYTPIADKRTGQPFVLDYEQIQEMRDSRRIGAATQSSPATSPDKFDRVISDSKVTPQASPFTSKMERIVTQLTRGEMGRKVRGGMAPSTGGKYSDYINRSANEHSVDPKLVQAVINQESAGNPNAKSNKGAAGLMQLMPATASEMGVKDASDPEQNISAGTKYLSQQLQKYNGDISLALAAYNAGPAVVDDFINGTNVTGKNPNKKVTGGIPPFKETQEYVKRIMAAYKK